jgi:hypothetical protein
MGEKGMESPAPSRSGVAGAAEAVGRATGVTDMAAAASGGTIGGAGSVAGSIAQGAGGGMGELSRPIEQANVFGQPPKG